MRKTGNAGKEVRFGYAGLALALMLMAALFWNGFAMTASAESKGTVTATSARVRQSAGTNSEAVGSVLNGATVTIISETQGTDGYVWYQIRTADGAKGYIRSDLVSKSADSTTGTTNVPAVNPSVPVEEVQPVGGTITGGSPVRVRVDASTAATSSIITTLSNGTGITVNGRATDADGHIWYLITFTSNNAETQGFVRSDYVSLSGELLPVTPEAPTGGETGTQTPETQEPAPEKKPYDTAKDAEGTWCLYDYEKGNSYPIQKLLESNANSAEKIMENAKTIKTQKIVITLLVILLVLAILAAALFFYKIRDLRDDAYFTAVEKQTMKERDAMKRQVGQKANNNRVMQTVGAGNTANAGNKPAGQKPVQRSNAQHAAGNNAAGQNSARTAPGSKPAATGERAPQGGRPVSRPANQQARPAAGAQRPISQNPAVKPNTAQNQAVKPNPVKTPQSRPMGEAVSQASPANAAVLSQARLTTPDMAKAPVNGAKDGKADGNQDWKNRKLMTEEEEDEFEFEFLNWDGEEK